MQEQRISSMVIVRISKGKKSIFAGMNVLLEADFIFHERSYGKSFYELKMPENDAILWKKWCKRNGYRIDIIPEQFTRSTDYRKTFFENNEPIVAAKYRCAYCGKKLLFKDTTVDHIFPVNQLSYSEKIRKRAAFLGITGANEEKNLVAACKRCNQRKGVKMGMWVIRGFLGKNEMLWKLRIAIRHMLVFGMILYTLAFFAIVKPISYSYFLSILQKVIAGQA